MGFLPVMLLRSLASQLDAGLGYYKVFCYISTVPFSQFFPLWVILLKVEKIKHWK